jgi:hypothetical protein
MCRRFEKWKDVRRRRPMGKGTKRNGKSWDKIFHSDALSNETADFQKQLYEIA